MGNLEIQQTMFKKRNISNKTTDICDMLVGIDVSQNEQMVLQGKRRKMVEEVRNVNEGDLRQMQSGKDDGNGRCRVGQSCRKEERCQSENEKDRKKNEQVIWGTFQNSSNYPNRNNNNSNIFQFEQKINNREQKQKLEVSRRQKQEEQKQIEDVFAELRQLEKEYKQTSNENERIQECRYQLVMRESDEDNLFDEGGDRGKGSMNKKQLNGDHQYQHQLQRQHNQRNKPPISANEVLIQDESEQVLQIVEDYGQIEEGDSDSQRYQNGYENEIIKKALSKEAYQKISKELGSSGAKRKKNRILGELERISYTKVGKKIGKDLRGKREKKRELENQLKYIGMKIGQREKQIGEKMRTRKKLEGEIDQVQRILEMLYYFGSEINIFNEEGLIRLSEEEDWREKIDRMRNYIKKNKQKFQNVRKTKQKQGNDGERKSEGEVEEIPKHRESQGWSEWQNDDEEGEDEESGRCREVEDDEDEQIIDIDD